MICLRLFATAREAAGRGRDEFTLAEAPTLDVLFELARTRYGTQFSVVLETARIWVNGEEPTSRLVALRDGDEVAVLPPVSGG